VARPGARCPGLRASRRGCAAAHRRLRFSLLSPPSPPVPFAPALPPPPRRPLAPPPFPLFAPPPPPPQGCRLRSCGRVSPPGLIGGFLFFSSPRGGGCRGPALFSVVRRIASRKYADDESRRSADSRLGVTARTSWAAHPHPRPSGCTAIRDALAFSGPSSNETSTVRVVPDNTVVLALTDGGGSRSPDWTLQNWLRRVLECQRSASESFISRAVLVPASGVLRWVFSRASRLLSASSGDQCPIRGRMSRAWIKAGLLRQFSRRWVFAVVTKSGVSSCTANIGVAAVSPGRD